MVCIKDKDTLANLMLMLTLDFDVILGIDCLTLCFDKVDCYHKLVKFKFPREPSFLIYGHDNPMFTRVMPTMATRKMPR